MSAQRTYHISAAEYLESERAAKSKSEYFNGEIFAMSGASEPHNAIVFDLAREIGTQLKGKSCRGYASDMRVRIRDFGIDKYTYPDVTIVCGDREFEDTDVDTLVNPSIIIEVLSPSTEAYDRGAKFAHYRRIASLQEYVLVSQTAPLVEHFRRREDDRWLLTEFDGLDKSVSLPSADVTISLSEIYYNVEFREPAPNESS